MSSIDKAGSEPRPRIARIVIVGADGAVMGQLAAVPVPTPWWQDVEPVVAAVRSAHGISVTILRLLSSEQDAPHGGEVTYLAETFDRTNLEPWVGELDSQVCRQKYASPGGPAADLMWAGRVLAGLGSAPVGAPIQVRSWNLSSIWRIPTAAQVAWLKVVPPFFAHEGALIAALGNAPVPRLLGHDGGRLLLAEIPGVDLYEADLPQLLEMISLLAELQQDCVGRVEELMQLGVPDWRGPALDPAIANLIALRASEFSGGEIEALRAFAHDLPARFASIADCGLPDTLIHGDFHPGNVRGDEGKLTILDWGDSGIGHPLLDQPAFLERLDAAQITRVQEHWHAELADRFPGSDPVRATALLAPVGAARQAVVYQRFLDRIEPAERVYHRLEPSKWLRRALALL